MRAGAGAQLVNELHAAGDRGAKADAVVRPVYVVVHRLGDGHDWEAFAVQALAKAERVIAADGDQAVDAQELKVLEHVRRKVAQALVGDVGLGVLRIAQETGNVLGLDLGGIGAAGVQECAARAVDRAHAILVQLQVVLFIRRGIFGVQVQQAAPATSDADDLVTFVHGAIDHCLDAGIQAGDITATRQNTNSHPWAPLK